MTTSASTEIAAAAAAAAVRKGLAATDFAWLALDAGEFIS